MAYGSALLGRALTQLEGGAAQMLVLLLVIASSRGNSSRRNESNSSVSSQLHDAPELELKHHSRGPFSHRTDDHERLYGAWCHAQRSCELNECLWHARPDAYGQHGHAVAKRERHAVLRVQALGSGASFYKSTGNRSRIATCNSQASSGHHIKSYWLRVAQPLMMGLKRHGQDPFSHRTVCCELAG